MPVTPVFRGWRHLDPRSSLKLGAPGFNERPVSRQRWKVTEENLTSFCRLHMHTYTSCSVRGWQLSSHLCAQHLLFLSFRARACFRCIYCGDDYFKEDVYSLFSVNFRKICIIYFQCMLKDPFKIQYILIDFTLNMKNSLV